MLDFIGYPDWRAFPANALSSAFSEITLPSSAFIKHIVQTVFLNKATYQNTAFGLKKM